MGFAFATLIFLGCREQGSKKKWFRPVTDAEYNKE